MRDPVRHLFLSAARLRQEPEKEGPRSPAERTPSPEEASPWEAAAAIARRVGQEPIFLHFLRSRFPFAPLAPETLSDLENQSRFHAFRWLEIRECAESAFDTLAGRGIRPVLLKGISLAGECYVPPHLRPMRDIDILVREDEIEDSKAALEACGFSSRREDESSGFFEKHHHLPPLFHAATGICLEVHHHIMRLPPWFEGFPEVTEFWKGLRDSAVFPGKASILDPSLQILTTSIHITHGDTIGRRAQNIIDLARILELHAERIDWDRIVRYASSQDTARSLAVSLGYLAREGLPAAPDDVLHRLLAASRLNSWEMALLSALTDRYRIGSPPPWRWVSGRVSNILWRQALRRGSTSRRIWSTLRQVLKR